MPARAERAGARALVALYCPAAARAVFDNLSQLESEIQVAVSPRLDHTVAHARLEWWRGEAARTARGGPEHPLTRALQAQLAAAGAPALALEGLIDNAAWDLAGAAFPDERALSAYCERWARAFILPFTAVLGHADPLGSLRLGTQLCRLELLLRSASADRDSRPAEGTRSVTSEHELAATHARARDALAQAARALPLASQRPLRPLLVWAALLHRQSRRAAARPVRAGPAQRLQPMDGWRAWRAARRAAQGRFRLDGERP